MVVFTNVVFIVSVASSSLRASESLSAPAAGRWMKRKKRKKRKKTKKRRRKENEKNTSFSLFLLQWEKREKWDKREKWEKREKREKRESRESLMDVMLNVDHGKGMKVGQIFSAKSVWW